MKKVLFFLLAFTSSAFGQYTQMQWGMNKTVTPYEFGANINGTWRNLGTVSSGGVWDITASKLNTNQIGPSSGSSAAPLNYNHINIPSENYALTGNSIARALMIDYVFGGINTQGARDGITISLTSLGSNNADSNPFYTGVYSFILLTDKSGPDGANGSGYISQVVTAPGSTVWNIIGYEAGVHIASGATSVIRNGINLVSDGYTLATGYDAAVLIGGAAGSGKVGWKNGIYFSRQDSARPIEPTGCMICTDNVNDTVAKGVDISAYTITGNAWSSPNGAYISGAGTVGGKNMTLGSDVGIKSQLEMFSGAASVYTLGKDASNNFFIYDSTAAKTAFSIANGFVTLGEAGNGAAIVGTTSGGNATAGNVGEVFSLEVLSGSAVSLTTAVAANVGSVSLTAGDWDCNGNVSFLPTGTTSTSAIYGWISTTSATNPGAPNKGGFSAIAPGTPAVGYSPGTLSVGPFRVNVSTTTTVYLGASSNFSASTNKAYGFMGCRRVR